jgi:hydrogenase expression/formation protein HypC
MCLGLPMTVVSTDGDAATVEGWGQTRLVGTLLVGPVAVGDVVLVHKNDALRVLEPDEVAPLMEAVRDMLGDPDPAPNLDGGL